MSLFSVGPVLLPGPSDITVQSGRQQQRRQCNSDDGLRPAGQRLPAHLAALSHPLNLCTDGLRSEDFAVPIYTSFFSCTELSALCSALVHAVSVVVVSSSLLSSTSSSSCTELYAKHSVLVHAVSVMVVSLPLISFSSSSCRVSHTFTSCSCSVKQ